MAKASKKQKDIQQVWCDRLNRSKKVRKSWKDKFRVDLARQFFEGQQNIYGFPKEDWISVPKVYGFLKSTLPMLYSQNPYCYIKVRKCYDTKFVEDPQGNQQILQGMEIKAKVRQSMVNYLLDECDLKPKARIGILDAMFQYGVLKVHHSATFEKNPDAGKPMLASNQEVMVGDDGNPLMEPEEIPVNERYNITRVHPDDILWSEDAGPLEDEWPWLAQRFVQPIDKVRKNKNFSAAAIAKLKDSDGVEDQEERQREERKKGGDIKGRAERLEDKEKEGREPKMVVWYEIYDLEKKEWMAIAENGEIPLMAPRELPPGVEKHPFVFLFFTPRDDSPLPIPPVSPLIDLSHEIDDARSKLKRHRKRFNRKYKATGPWEDDELSKLESGDDGAVIRAQTGCELDPIKDAPLDNMNYSEINMLNRDFIEASGSADEARGIAGADSATQAGILDKRMDIKEGDSLQMVAEWIERLCRKLDQLVKANISRDEAVKITGPQGEYWQIVREEDYRDIAGEFQYKVSVGTMTPNLPHIERASWMAFLQLLQGFPQLALSKRLMDKMAEMHNIEDQAMIEEIQTIAKQIVTGQMTPPANAGSQAGVPDQNVARSPGGQNGGFQALNMPGAGNME